MTNDTFVLFTKRIMSCSVTSVQFSLVNIVINLHSCLKLCLTLFCYFFFQGLNCATHDIIVHLSRNNIDE